MVYVVCQNLRSAPSVCDLLALDDLQGMGVYVRNVSQEGNCPGLS